MDAKPIPDGTRAVLRLTCPQCKTTTEFPDVEGASVYICPACGEPIDAEAEVS
jgi:hypothetical protein